MAPNRRAALSVWRSRLRGSKQTSRQSTVPAKLCSWRRNGTQISGQERREPTGRFERARGNANRSERSAIIVIGAGRNVLRSFRRGALALIWIAVAQESWIKETRSGRRYLVNRSRGFFRFRRVAGAGSTARARTDRSGPSAEIERRRSTQVGAPHRPPWSFVGGEIVFQEDVEHNPPSKPCRLLEPRIC